MADTGVVYLYRFAEGEDPVRRFLRSYRSHPAGLEHDLHVVLKGFPDEASLGAARALFGTLPISAIEVDDTGLDIGSYFSAARAVSNPRLLFLNTFSEILADNWLVNFDRALATPGVGLAGATGSLQSLSSGFDAIFFSVFRRIVGPFKGSSSAIGSADDQQEPIKITRIARVLLHALLYPVRVYQYGRYPNPHIRTNGFMIRRDVFLSLRPTKFKSKNDAYRFENGRVSMTRQIMARGLLPVVIDRNGKAYFIPDWKSSSTFWVDGQVNLMIADNQTRSYADGGAQFREGLKHKAWDHPAQWKARWYS